MKIDINKIQDKKRNLGQILTSPQIAAFMVKLSSKATGVNVLEPCAGEGVFYNTLVENNFSSVQAIEIDDSLIPTKFKNKIICNDFLTYNFDKKFDLIIGNPPYVRWKHLTKETQNILINSSFWKNRINALSDLLQTFIFKSVDLLNEGGEIIFITPFFWLQSPQ